MKFTLETITNIDEAIIKYGIPSYIQKWKKHKKKSLPKNIEEINKYVKIYHSHSSVTLNTNIKKKKSLLNNQKKIPSFYYDQKNKIGRIVFYQYILDFNDKYDKCPLFKKIVLEVQNKINFWIKNNIKGIIIDLRCHSGGWFAPFVYSLSSFLENCSLFSFNNQKTSQTEKNWINYSRKKINYSSHFSNCFKTPKIKIGIIIGKKTNSSGEFCASIFYRKNKNIKIFGNRTKGNLSINNTFKINKNIKIHLPTNLITTVDGQFHHKEYLEPDLETNNPVYEAKKWICQ